MIEDGGRAFRCRRIGGSEAAKDRRAVYPPSGRSAQQVQAHQHGGRGQQEAVEPVQDAAVPGKHAPESFTPAAA